MRSKWLRLLYLFSAFAPAAASSAELESRWVEIRHAKGQALHLACGNSDGKCDGDIRLPLEGGDVNFHVMAWFTDSYLYLAFLRDGEWRFFASRPYFQMPIGPLAATKQRLVLREPLDTDDDMGISRRLIMRTSKAIAELEVTASPTR